MTERNTTRNSTLSVRQMHIIWRDTFVLDQPVENFLEAGLEYLRGLPCTVADRFTSRDQKPISLQVIERASRNVARSGYNDLLHLELAPLAITDLQPTLRRLRRSPQSLTDENIFQVIDDANHYRDWVSITPVVTLYRAGAGLVDYHATFRAPKSGGYPVKQAIDRVRMGINPQLLRLPPAWCEVLPEQPEDWHIDRVLDLGGGQCAAICMLRHLSHSVIVDGLDSLGHRERKRRKKKQQRDRPQPKMPTGSTTVILSEVDPTPPRDFSSYVEKHAPALHGIGAMDAYYEERSPWLIDRDFEHNLSTDSESAVYLLGNSELLLFNEQLPPILSGTTRRLRLPNDDHALTYLYMHYVTLIEWVYLQEALLRVYLQRLERMSMLNPPPRRQMLRTLKGALGDLIQYQERITPFATRIEFLERVREYHKLPELVERFERKQDLLLEYASEFHDYREARASEFLNWLAGILTGAALAELITGLAGITPAQPALYLGVTGACIGLVLIVLIGLQLLRAR